MHQNAVHAVSTTHERFPTVSRKEICGAVTPPEDGRFADYAPAHRRWRDNTMAIYFGTLGEEHSRPQSRKRHRIPGLSEISPFCRNTARTNSLFLTQLEDPATNIRSAYFQNRRRGAGCDLRVNRDASNTSVRKKAIYTWVERRSGP